MAVTMTQVAKKVGVSVGVVSRLLRDDPTLSISDKRRREIYRTVEQMGGVEFRGRRQQTHVVLMPLPSNLAPDWVQRNIMTGDRMGKFQQALEQQGYALHLTFVDEQQIESFIRRVVAEGKQCDGLLLYELPMTESAAQMLFARTFPHICFNRLYERLGVNTVWAHTSEGLRQAVEHLKSQGHERVAFVGPRGSSTYPEVVAALAQAELPIDQANDCWVPPIPKQADEMAWFEQTRRAMHDWLDRVWPESGVTAVMCRDDRVAAAVAQAVVEKGLTPGQALSIVGCGHQLDKDIHPAGRPVCRLTTVDTPFGRIGRRGAELLLNQILHGQTQIVHERVPTRLIVQESTGPAPVRHPAKPH